MEAKQKKNLKNSIVEYIFDAILNDEYKQNDQIKEVSLAAKLKVSRIPVREALLELVNFDILEQIEKRGVFVKEVTSKDIFNIYEAQGTIEAFLATSFAIHATQEDMDMLDKLLLKMCDKSNTIKVIASVGREFHEHCLKYATNDILLKNLAKINKRSLLIYSKILPKLYTIEEVEKEHQKIIDALKSRKKDYIEKVIKEHYVVAGYKLAFFILDI